MGCQLCIQCGQLRDGVPSCFFGIPTGRNRVDRYDQLVKVFRFDDDPIGGDNAVVVLYHWQAADHIPAGAEEPQASGFFLLSGDDICCVIGL